MCVAFFTCCLACSSGVFFVLVVVGSSVVRCGFVVCVFCCFAFVGSRYCRVVGFGLVLCLGLGVFLVLLVACLRVVVVFAGGLFC